MNNLEHLIENLEALNRGDSPAREIRKIEWRILNSGAAWYRFWERCNGIEMSAIECLDLMKEAGLSAENVRVRVTLYPGREKNSDLHRS